MSYKTECKRDCPDRKIGCHDGCERYARDREEAKKRRKYLQRHARLYGSTVSQRREQVEKAIRRHGKRQ